MPRLRFGVIGAAWIADRAVLPALRAAHNADAVAIASRSPNRAAAMAKRHDVAQVHPTYDALLEDETVDAVYIALVNSLHLPWTLRALEAGKHVLCEKPLGVDASEVRQMARAASSFGLTLMEAFMYRFHPRMRALRESADYVRFLNASFGFALHDRGNPRLRVELGGGALLDVGCYTLDAARWFCGEPDAVSAVARVGAVDISVAAALHFPGGAEATVWASLDSPEHQELVLVTGDKIVRIEQPFTAWHDPDDPYQLMVEAFSQSVLDGAPAPLSLDDSTATARLMDRVRGSWTAISESATR